jgi:hypothetical protein
MRQYLAYVREGRFSWSWCEPSELGEGSTVVEALGTEDAAAVERVSVLLEAFNAMKDVHSE